MPAIPPSPNRYIVHGRVTKRSLALQLKLVRLLNPDTEIVYEPSFPNNEVLTLVKNQWLTDLLNEDD